MHKSLLEAIGNTPLVQLNYPTEAKVYAKLEYLNPGGSVKDRSAKYMIEKAEETGILKPGGTIIDASSGNHGIALAMIGKIKGYRVIITVSEKISKEKYNTLKAYGAEVIVCKSTQFIEDPENYHYVAQRLAKEIPNSFMPNQYYNTMNRDAHQALLGPEIYRQTEGKITHFFAGAGTTGTVSGVGRYLKSQNPAIKIIAIDSINSYKATNGHPKPYAIEGIGMDFDTPVTDFSVIDEIVNVSDEETVLMLRSLAQQQGLLVGPSSGAVACGVQHYLSNLKAGDIAVIIFGDSGRAYLSKGFYAEESSVIPSIALQEKQVSL